LMNKFTEDVIKEKKVLVEDHPLSGKTIVITGFRDKQLDDILKGFGAKLGSSVSKNTFLVIVKNKDEDTGKASEAKKLEIPIFTYEEFKNKYL